MKQRIGYKAFAPQKRYGKPQKRSVIVRRRAKSEAAALQAGVHRNPYNLTVRHEWKNKAQLVIMCASIICTVALLLYHPFFKVRVVSIQGLQRIEGSQIYEAINGILDSNYLLIFPSNNYFILNLDQMSEILKQRFPIERISIQKTFPKTMSIIVDEKISTIIFDDTHYYSYVGLDGNVIERIRSVGEDEWTEHSTKVSIESASSTLVNEPTGEQIQADPPEPQLETIIERTHVPPYNQLISEAGDYPIVFAQTETAPEPGERAMTKDLSEAVIQWFEFARSRDDISISYIEIPNPNTNDLIIHTRAGWYVRAGGGVDNVIESQIDALSHILDIEPGRSFEYIDVRFPERVFWK